MRVLPIFCSLIILLLPQAHLTAKTIKMAVFKLEPFMMIDPESREVIGVTVDYWKQFIAPEMGVDLEIAGLFPIHRALEMLKTGDVDVVSQLTRIPEREAQFLYPDKPLTKIISCIVVLKDSPLKEVRRTQDLFGMTIGFIEAAYIPPMLKHEKITLDMVTTTDFRQMNYDKLIYNRVDASLDINHVSLMYFLGTHGYLDQLRVILLPTEPVGVSSIFRRTKEGAALRDAFNKAHEKGLAQKVFEKLSQTYLNQSRN